MSNLLSNISNVMSSEESGTGGQETWVQILALSIKSSCHLRLFCTSLFSSVKGDTCVRSSVNVFLFH